MTFKPILNKKDTGCFYIRKREWLNRQIPLHFLLLFLFCYFGVVSLIYNNPSFFKKDIGELGLASLVPPISLNGKLEAKQLSNGAKLPLSNNKIYKLPLSFNKFYKLPLSSKKEPPKPSVASLKIAKKIYPEVNFSKEEFQNGKYIEVDISDQVLMIYGDGELKGIFKVSTGMSRLPTPIGRFKVLRKSANVWSFTYKCWMPYSLEFSSGLFIHELPYWPGGAREGSDHLGRPVSHGCIRLGIGPAKEVYDFVNIGTPVIIHK